MPTQPACHNAVEVAEETVQFHRSLLHSTCSFRCSIESVVYLQFGSIPPKLQLIGSAWSAYCYFPRRQSEHIYDIWQSPTRIDVTSCLRCKEHIANTLLESFCDMTCKQLRMISGAYTLRHYLVGVRSWINS